MEKVKERFSPTAIVCQCGADGLSDDPMGTWNLTHESYSACLQVLTDWQLPLLVLGGGKLVCWSVI